MVVNVPDTNTLRQCLALFNVLYMLMFLYAARATVRSGAQGFVHSESIPSVRRPGLLHTDVRTVNPPHSRWSVLTKELEGGTM